MDAQTYHDLHRTITRLEKVIGHARFQDGRMGIIPPTAMGEVIAEMAVAIATIADLTREWEKSKTLG